MSTVVTIDHCKKLGHKLKDCKIFATIFVIEKSGKFDSDRIRWCDNSSGHSNEDCYQQKLEMEKSEKYKNSRKSGVLTIIVKGTRMGNVTSRKEAANVRKVLLMMVEIVKKKKSLLIVPSLAAMENMFVPVQGEKI